VSKTIYFSALLCSICAFTISTSAQPKASASIQGVIHFKGKAPTAKPIDAKSDTFCASQKLVSDSVVVSKGKLKDVHVRIKNGTAGKHSPPKARNQE
jgi:hypothetical protein